MRLIDADELIETLETQDYSNAPNTLAEWTPQDMTNAEIFDINNAPTVDAELVRHGRWLKTGQSFVNPNKFRNYFCSECGLELDEHIRSKPNYCPHCGARMEEVEA